MSTSAGVQELTAPPDLYTELYYEFLNEYSISISISNETVLLDNNTMPLSSLNKVADAGLSVTFTLSMGTFTLDPDAIRSTIAAANGADITISLTQTQAIDLTQAQQEVINPDDLVFRITMVSTDYESGIIQYINNFDGYITVTVPYHGHMPVAVWYLCNEGILDGVWFRYDRQEQTVSFMTNHLSLYVVAPILESFSYSWIIVGVTGAISILIAGVFYVYWRKREKRD